MLILCLKSSFYAHIEKIACFTHTPTQPLPMKISAFLRNILAVIIAMMFVIAPSFSQEQTVLDSLESLLPKQTGLVKRSNLGELCYQYSFIDTKKAIDFGNQSVAVAVTLNDSVELANAYNDLSIPYYFAGDYDSSLVYNFKSLKIRQAVNDSLGVAKSYSKIANSYYELGELPKALEYNFKALELFEATGNDQYAGNLYSNIGNIYEVNGNYEKALEFQFKSIAYAEKYNNRMMYISAQGNVANIYQRLKDYKKSNEVYMSIIPETKAMGNKGYLASIYQGMGVNARLLNDNALGIDYYEKSLQLYEEIGVKSGISLVLVNLGLCYMDEGNFAKSELMLKRGLELSKESNSYSQLRHAYQGLARLENHKGNYEESEAYFDLYVSYVDSIYNENSNTLLSEMQVKYETAEKEKQIAKQEVSIANEQLRVKSRNNALWGLGIALLTLLFVGRYVYKQQKFKEQQLVEENRLKDQLSKVKVQNKLQEERLRISKDLHDNIGAQLTFIISSVDNLNYIFTSADEKLKEKLNSIAKFSRSTITQLRDTIWALNKDQIGFEDLKLRVLNFVESAKSAEENVQFSFFNSVETPIIFTAMQGVNVYRIIQESLNNALKYADATAIEVRIVEIKEHIVVEIIDNGKGFAINEVKKGNGLHNLEQRAEELHAEFNLSSSHTGTVVKMSIPINTLIVV